jgi:hypothetical protein
MSTCTLYGSFGKQDFRKNHINFLQESVYFRIMKHFLILV